MKKKIITLTMFLLMFFAITSNVDAASMSLSSSNLKPGQKVTVNYSGGPGVSGSWVGMYAVGASDMSHITWQYIHANTSGSLQFNVPNNVGTYEFRAFSGGGASNKVGTSSRFTVTEYEATLTVSSQNVKVGDKIRLNYSGASGFSGSWVGMYAVGASDMSHITWQYIHTNTTGSLEFTVPNNVGTYEFRIFRGGGATTKIGSGGRFTVSEYTASLSTIPSNVKIGEKVRVSYSEASGFSGSWVGMYAVGASNTSHITWQYIQNSRSGTLEFTAPSTVGTYEFRIFRGGGASNMIGTGGRFTVGEFASTITVSPTSTNPGQKVRVNYSGASGVSGSWVGMYAVGASNMSHISWQYIHTNTTGSLEFTAPSTAGSYEFRVFRGSGASNMIGSGGRFTVGTATTTPTLTVSPSSATAGQNVTLSYSGASGAGGSWIGLYRTGTADTGYISWQRIDTNRSGSLQFIAPSTAGTYEFRMFSGGSYSRIGIGGQFTVSASTVTPTITVSPTSTNPGQQVTMNYSGASGVSGSWIGMYRVGTNDTAYISWQRIDTNRSGSLQFIAPSTAGTYEFRIFSGGSYSRVGSGGTFTVGTGTAAPVLRGTGLSNGIKLDWTASSASNVVGYNLYRGTISGSYSSIPVTDFYIRDLVYTDFTGRPNVTYYYIVKPVYRDDTEGPASNEVAVKWTSSSDRGKLELQIGNPNMRINGVIREIDPGRGTAPTIINGRTVLPIRAVVESMGGSIEWDGNTRKVTIRSEGKTIEMWIDNRIARVNGIAEELDVPPQIVNGRTMVPFRFVGEALGKEIKWDGSTRIATMYLN